MEFRIKRKRIERQVGVDVWEHNSKLLFSLNLDHFMGLTLECKSNNCKWKSNNSKLQLRNNANIMENGKMDKCLLPVETTASSAAR